MAFFFYILFDIKVRLNWILDRKEEIYMAQENVEKHFKLLDEMVEYIQEKMNVTYIEGLTIGLEYIVTEVAPSSLTKDVQEKIDKKIKFFTFDALDKEEIRKVLQLTILKGMKGATQQQHLITPDTVAMFIGYVAQKLIGSKEKLRVFDPASGSANLLMAVLNQLTMNKQAYGSEIDPTLIQLSLMSANLQRTEVEFFHQDSLQPFLLEPVDLIVSDLPVGYYPDDVRSSQFKLNATKGHAYSHHLLMEQSIHYTKEGGYLLFVIPNFLFDSDQADKLHVYLQQEVHIIGLLQLPLSIFRDENQAKSILVLQKKGEATKAPKETLLAQLPSFKDVRATEQIVEKMNQWFKNEGY